MHELNSNVFDLPEISQLNMRLPYALPSSALIEAQLRLYSQMSGLSTSVAPGLSNVIFDSLIVGMTKFFDDFLIFSARYI